VYWGSDCEKKSRELGLPDVANSTARNDYSPSKKVLPVAKPKVRGAKRSVTISRVGVGNERGRKKHRESTHSITGHGKTKQESNV